MRNWISRIISFFKLSNTESISLSQKKMKRQLDSLREEINEAKKTCLSYEDKKELRKKYRKIKKIEQKKDIDPVNKCNYDCEYYFENGLRKVTPYYYTYVTYIKQRWLERSLADVIHNEFVIGSKDIINIKIEEGDILINDSKVSKDYILKSNDKMTHKVHRHEFPVLDKKIEILFQNEDLVVLNKPCSIPIHPIGRFNMNTILGILIKDHKMKPLRVVHRLDRLTSGILLLANNYITATSLSTCISNRQVSKYYLAQTKGKFGEMNQIIQCDEPLRGFNSKLGLHFVDKTSELSKPASTCFVQLGYDENSNTSLVLCKPLTGRTHQIRIHLQYLGNPIINDPIYNSLAWGPEYGKGAQFHKSIEQLGKDLGECHSIMKYKIMETGDVETLVCELSDPNPIASKFPLDTNCHSCKIGVDRIKIDTADLNLNLHAYRYRFHDQSWDFTAPSPDWAKIFENESVTEYLRKMTNNDEIL